MWGIPGKAKSCLCPCSVLPLAPTARPGSLVAPGKHLISRSRAANPQRWLPGEGVSQLPVSEKLVCALEGISLKMVGRAGCWRAASALTDLCILSESRSLTSWALSSTCFCINANYNGFKFTTLLLHWWFSCYSLLIWRKSWAWSLRNLWFPWKLTHISRICLYCPFRCSKEIRLQRCQTIISLHYEDWTGKYFSCWLTIYALLSCNSFNQVLWSNSGLFGVIHRAGFTHACNRENVNDTWKCLYLQSTVRDLLFVSRDKQGSSQSGWMRGWGSAEGPQQHHVAGKGDAMSKTQGAKSHLQSSTWEKLGLISNILPSFLAAFHSSFPLVWWLWLSQDWAESGPGCLLISVSAWMSSHSRRVAEGRDCAKCEQTQPIPQPGGRAVNCEVAGCEVTARAVNERERGKKTRCAHILLPLATCQPQRSSKMWVNISTTKMTSSHRFRAYPWMAGHLCQKAQTV